MGIEERSTWRIRAQNPSSSMRIIYLWVSGCHAAILPIIPTVVRSGIRSSGSQSLSKGGLMLYDRTATKYFYCSPFREFLLSYANAYPMGVRLFSLIEGCL